MRQPVPRGFAHAEHAHADPTDRARDSIAIEIKRRQFRRIDFGHHIHLHAIDDRHEVLPPQVELSYRINQRLDRGSTHTIEESVDLRAPARQLAELGVAISGAVRNIIHGATESVNREHRLPLRRPQYAHGGVEGTACSPRQQFMGVGVGQLHRPSDKSM